MNDCNQEPRTRKAMIDGLADDGCCTASLTKRERVQSNRSLMKRPNRASQQASSHTGGGICQSARAPDCQTLIGGLHQDEYLHSRRGPFGLQYRVDGVEDRVSRIECRVASVSSTVNFTLYCTPCVWSIGLMEEGDYQWGSTEVVSSVASYHRPCTTDGISTQGIVQR